MSDPVADVHPDVRFRGLDPVDGGIAADGGLLGRRRLQKFSDAAYQSRVQQVLLLGESRFMQALRVALVPVESSPQKQSLL